MISKWSTLGIEKNQRFLRSDGAEEGIQHDKLIFFFLNRGGIESACIIRPHFKVQLIPKFQFLTYFLSRLTEHPAEGYCRGGVRCVSEGREDMFVCLTIF